MRRMSTLAGFAGAALTLSHHAIAHEAGHVSSPDETHTLSAPRIEYTLWTLENGLMVIALPDKSTANVTTSLWYKVGSKHDPEGRAGFSHLFEHILSRKTVNMPYNMINRLTEDVGGQRNASNWIDRTNYYETVPAEYLETMLWTHRERMAFPVVDKDVFEKERAVVKEELRQRVLAPPYGRLQRFVIPENAFDVLPMRRPGIGSIADLDSATLEDARAFHQAYYGPDTATLIVAGNFETTRLRILVDKYFGDIPPRRKPLSLEIKAEEPPRTKPRSFAASAPGLPLPVVGGIWKAPKVTHPDAPALELLSTILAAGDNSRLHAALVRTGKAVNASHFDSMTMDGGYIANFAILSSEADLEEAAEILTDQIEKVRDAPVTEAELVEAKNTIFSAALYSRQTVRGRAFELGEALVSSGDPDAADIRLRRIAAVTVEDIQRVASRWLDPDAKVSMTYTAGDDDPSAYTNPYPRPNYGTVPPARGRPRRVRPEKKRMVPPPPSEAPEVIRADFVQTKLANGIALTAVKTTDVPIATITIVFPGGNATDTPDKAGLAGMAAQLADKGTEALNATEIAAMLESLGASIGISSGADGTYASLTVPTANLPDAGAILVEIVRNASYPQMELDRERKRTLDSLAAVLQNPGSLARLVATRVLYGNAPYGLVRNETSLPSITREDLIEHRGTYWHPATAKIVVSGGLEAAEAEAVINDLFGGWTSSSPPPPPVANPAGDETLPRTVVVDMPEAGQAAVIAGFRTTSRASDEFYPLWLTNTVLGSGSNGRLFEEVRTRRGLSYGAYSSLGQSLDTALLTARSQTKNETADEVAAVFLEQFKLLAQAPLDEPDLQKRRLFLSGAVSRNLETSSGFNEQIADLMLRGIEPGEAFAIAERLANVSAEQTVQVAEKYLAPERASLIIVGDASKFLDDLKKVRDDVEVIPASELDLAAVDLRKVLTDSGTAIGE